MGRAPFEYGGIGNVVKFAAGFFADVKCEFVIFAISQMFFACYCFTRVKSGSHSGVALFIRFSYAQFFG